MRYEIKIDGYWGSASLKGDVDCGPRDEEEAGSLLEITRERHQLLEMFSSLLDSVGICDFSGTDAPKGQTK